MSLRKKLWEILQTFGLTKKTNAPVTDFAEVSKAVMREYYSILNDNDIPKSIILAVLPDDKIFMKPGCLLSG